MENDQKRRKYEKEFKAQAVELAKEIGTKEAAEKLGIAKYQTLMAWMRHSKKIQENSDFKELEEAKKEIKKLKRELESERKAVAILRDAAAFFCQDVLK